MSSNIEIEGKLPPQNIKVEESVLAAIMASGEVMIEIAGILNPDCFYKDFHRNIYEFGILPLFSQGETIDLLTVMNQLKKNKKYTDDTPHELSIVAGKVEYSASVTSHSLILKQEAIRRGIIKTASQMVKKAYMPEIDALDLVDAAAREIDEIGLTVTSSRFTKIDKITSNSIKKIEQIQNSGIKITGVPSGFDELDKITNGFQNSDLILCAARTAMGKTAFVQAILRNAAIDYGKSVAMFSLEMSESQLGTRFLAAETGIHMEKLQRGTLSSQEWDVLNSTINPLVSSNIYIDDQPGLSVFEMNTKARKLKHDDPDLAMIVIDYLQLMNGKIPGSGNQNREQEVSCISRSLKILAKELDIPIIALSQLSRAVESRGGDKKPMLSDLRESGSQEQDADIVMFIYRPEYYGFETDEAGNSLLGKAEIIIAKHRNGRLGNALLRFQGEISKFSSIDNFDGTGVMFESDQE